MTIPAGFFIPYVCITGNHFRNGLTRDLHPLEPGCQGSGANGSPVSWWPVRNRLHWGLKLFWPGVPGKTDQHSKTSRSVRAWVCNTGRTIKAFREWKRECPISGSGLRYRQGVPPQPQRPCSVVRPEERKKGFAVRRIPFLSGRHGCNRSRRSTLVRFAARLHSVRILHIQANSIRSTARILPANIRPAQKSGHESTCWMKPAVVRASSLRPAGGQLLGLRASFASIHSVAWGTFISRSLGINLPVVLQIP